MTDRHVQDPVLNISHESRIRGVLEELGPLPATHTTFPLGRITRGIGEEFLNRWIREPDSHLLVVSGGYGSGKSHMILRTSARSTGVRVVDYAVDDIPGSAEIGGSECLLIDHFDEVAGYPAGPKPAPDLRLVSRHLRQRKVCIVTNRPLTDKNHELVRQLRYPTRLEALGVRKLEVIALENWSVGEVQAAVEKHLPDSKQHFAKIAASSDVDMSNLLRPMVLRMLLSILAEQQEGWIPEYGEIYDLYLEHSLSWDFDQGRSLISSLEKRAVLTSLAYSLFSGQDHLSRHAGVNSSMVISDKLMEVCHSSRVDAALGLLQDFLATNRCLKLVGTGAERGGDKWIFESKTVFEYFLAESLVSRYLEGIGIHSKDTDFVPSILDTRVLYFARRALGRSSQESIFSQLRSLDLAHIDRLILLYLVEDMPEFMSLLSRAPEDYFAYLNQTSGRIDAHFVVKIARFQLVSSGRMSASEYLDYIRFAEEPSHLEVEMQICRTPTGNLHYLETRFHNPSLRNSAAISIYRIAQLDPARAKQLLEEERALTDLQMKECAVAFRMALESNVRRLRPVV